MCRVRSVGERKKKKILPCIDLSFLYVCTTLAADASLEYNGETQSNEHLKAPRALGVSQPVGFLIPKSLFSSLFPSSFARVILLGQSHGLCQVGKELAQFHWNISKCSKEIIKKQKKMCNKLVVGNRATRRSAGFSLAKNVCAWKSLGNWIWIKFYF